MTHAKTPNPKMPGPRRLFGKTVQWMKAKKAAMDAAHDFAVPGERQFRQGEARRGTGAVWQWAQAKRAAADAAHAQHLPGQMMYRRGPRAATGTAWQWHRAREEAMVHAWRRPIGSGRG